MGLLTERFIKKQRDLSNISPNPPFPKIIKIDICNTCNYSCIFCPQSKQINKKGCIDHDLCQKIMRDAYEAGAKEICLSATGEPLINPHLVEYCNLAKSIGYTYIFFNTNGYLMTSSLSEKILKGGGCDSVKFSINAAKSYYLVHGVDAYQKVLDNLKEFDKLRKQLNSSCKLYVSYVATKYTKQEAEIVKKDTASYCDEVMVMNANNRGGLADEVTDELYAGDDDYSYKYPCSQIFNNVYVTAEGYLVACCQDFENNMVIADLNKNSVYEAWNCETFVNFRKNFLEKKYNGLLCENCLHNKHNPILPLWKEKAGYKQSKLRIKNLGDRIKLLRESNDT